MPEIAGMLLLSFAVSAHAASKARPRAAQDDPDSIAGLPVIEERIKLTPRAGPLIPAPPPLEARPPHSAALRFSKAAPAVPRAGATVILEQVDPSFARRAVNRVPLLNKLQSREFKGGDRFIAARPVGGTTPFVPRDVRSKLAGIVPVELRISIDKTGAVAETELLSRNVNSALAEIAVRAASHWDFTPAHIDHRPVSSEMLVHMRFGEAR
ncbi:MAG: energy transducer TonB [Bryobacteraceae bacterium]